jgi:hypothetical protein
MLPINLRQLDHAPPAAKPFRLLGAIAKPLPSLEEV